MDKIVRYHFSGSVRGSGKKITSSVSAPLGISPTELYNRLKAFMIAFENVKITIN